MNESVIQKAITVLNDGGVIVFPTDTAFGIGCRIDKPTSIDRLFAIRNRPLTQATPVLVSGHEMAYRYMKPPSAEVQSLLDRFWPGALTVVVPCAHPEEIYSPVRGGGDTIGLRMPANETTLAILRGIGVPMLGPSANFHGLATPYTYEMLDSNLLALVDYVVPGVCSVGLASTVVDCSTEPFVILRQGTVDIAI